ncbi:MAG: hypothetical protein ABI876_18050, partial [Bacteroidota bacterium]
LYRSGNGRDLRHRIMRRQEADVRYASGGFTNPYRIGALNDSSKRYEMLGLVIPSPGGNDMLAAFSGGANGPGLAYDAHFAGEDDIGIHGNEVFDQVSPIGDVDGNGYDDVLCTYFRFGFDGGIAFVLGGGPEIPRDPSLGVEAIAGEGHVSAISLWPMPARDELHIAWRGDLTKMPSRFVVHDLMGREVANGSVESWRGEALWNCSTVSPGVYVLSIMDASGNLLHSIRLLKE